MLSIIKTAIITIIISFISGVLLDGYKNFAPRILFSMEKPVHLKINNKKVWAFTFVMRNISNKTIHNLSLNIQGHYDNLKIHEARITKGLKFETSSENNNYNVSIPFLSKNDEFSAKIFVESSEGIAKKPIVTLRSPENFKQINGFCKNGYFATIAGIPKDISESLTKRENKKQGTNSNNKRINSKDKHFFNYKKILATMMGVTVLIYAIILIGKYNDNTTDEFTGGDNKFNTQEAEASLIQSESSGKSSNTGSKVNNTKDTENAGSIKNDNNAINNSKNKVSNDNSNKTSLEESNKKQSSKETNINNNTKASNSSLKNNETTSVDKEKAETDSKKPETDDNKTNSIEVSKTNKNNSNNAENKQNEIDKKTNSEKTTEQEKNKLQGSSNTNQKDTKTITSASGNE